jgi:hypothetical protein
MEGLEQDFRSLEESHGKNVLNLVLVTAYLRKLLDNPAVSKFLTSRHADIHAEFRKLVDTASLSGVPECNVCCWSVNKRSRAVDRTPGCEPAQGYAANASDGSGSALRSASVSVSPRCFFR